MYTKQSAFGHNARLGFEKKFLILWSNKIVDSKRNPCSDCYSEKFGSMESYKCGFARETGVSAQAAAQVEHISCFEFSFIILDLNK